MQPLWNKTGMSAGAGMCEFVTSPTSSPGKPQGGQKQQDPGQIGKPPNGEIHQFGVLFHGYTISNLSV